MMKKSSLGTGLSSLIPKREITNDLEENFSIGGNKSSVREISVSAVTANPNQPRYFFDEENLKELAESIRVHGVVQPIIVTELIGNKFELVAGERRLRASKLLGNKTIPAIIRQADSREKLELAIIENVQRHDLNPIEEARAYLKLKKDFELTQEEVARKMGKSRAAIANILRLLELPTEIQRGIVEKKITEGHARAILGLSNSEKQRALYDLILKKNLTVRETEAKVKNFNGTEIKSHLIKAAPDPKLQELENLLQDTLGTKVRIKKKSQKGSITIDFFSDEEFRKILEILHK